MFNHCYRSGTAAFWFWQSEYWIDLLNIIQVRNSVAIASGVYCKIDMKNDIVTLNVIVNYLTNIMIRDRQPNSLYIIIIGQDKKLNPI